MNLLKRIITYILDEPRDSTPVPQPGEREPLTPVKEL